MGNFADFFAPFGGFDTTSVLLRLSLATLFGGVIGLDRGSKRRAAGFRTYMLVCVGSALVMITAQYIHTAYPLSDPSRLGAQVISGIGFLGVGTIIVTRQHQVIGLTTAAGLWASACVGLAVGIGFYEGAILASIFIYLIITIMHKLDLFLYARPKMLDLFIELEETASIGDFLDLMRRHDVHVRHVEFAKVRWSGENGTALTVTIILPASKPHHEVTAWLRSTAQIRFIQEI